VRLVDVAQRSLQPEKPEPRQEDPVVGDGDAVAARAEAEGEPEGREPFIHGEGEELSHDLTLGDKE
jgi:hypothetical protein